MELSIDPLKPYLGAIKWLLIVAVLIGWAFYWHGVGAATWESKFNAEAAAHAATKAANATVLRGLADQAQEVADKAKAASDALTTYRKSNNQRYEKAVTDAKQASADLRADLRSGAVQLQPWWQCDSPAGSGAGDAADLAQGQDGHAQLRIEGALADVADGDTADAWISWLQSELTDTRSAVMAAGCAVEAGP